MGRLLKFKNDTLGKEINVFIGNDPQDLNTLTYNYVLSYRRFLELNPDTLTTLFVFNNAVKQYYISNGFPQNLIISLEDIIPYQQLSSSDGVWFYCINFPDIKIRFYTNYSQGSYNDPDNNWYAIIGIKNESYSNDLYYIEYILANENYGTPAGRNNTACSLPLIQSEKSKVYEITNRSVNNYPTFYARKDEVYSSMPDNFYYDYTNGEDIPFDSTDPFEDGGTSEGNEDTSASGGTGDSGGYGEFDTTSDTISTPSLPSVSGLNTGFFTAFICTNSQLQSVSNYLWGNLITDILDPNQSISDKIDALKKVIANPYDAIMGCSLIPVVPASTGSKELKMYGIISTGITLPYASSRWVTVNCGELNIKTVTNGYLDFAPYSKTTSLYLPYIGTVSVDIDLIQSTKKEPKTIGVIYHVDILTGICVAYITINGSVQFQYQGQCSTTIPVTNADYNGAINAGIGLIGNVSNIVSSGVIGAATGGAGGALVGATNSAVSQAGSIASNVMGMKPDIRSGGSVGSSGGILGVQKPYLIIERPRQSLPKNQNTYTGYPSNVRTTVGKCDGYTEFERIKLENIFLTAQEKTELESILKGGVYL